MPEAVFTHVKRTIPAAEPSPAAARISAGGVAFRMLLSFHKIGKRGGRLFFVRAVANQTHSVRDPAKR